MKTTKCDTKTQRKVQFPPLCHDALLLKEVAPAGPRGAFLEALCRAFCGRRAVLEAFFTHFAAFCWPPHLSPGLAAAAEESPRKMQNPKVQGRAASGGAPSEKRAGGREAQDFLPRLPEFLPILVLAKTKVS